MIVGRDFSGGSGAAAAGRTGEKAGPAQRAALYAALAALVVALATLTWAGVTGGAESGHTGGSADSGRTSAEDGRGAQDPDLSGSPSGRPAGEDALVANPLYETGRLAPLPCPAPVLDIDSPESVEAFLHTIADCLDHTWERQFRRAGIPFTPPERVFWSEPGTSPCRAYPSSAGAFYCRANTSLYIGTSDVVAKWNRTEESAVYASLLAHEYGHHVQGESGLLEYYHERRRLEPDKFDQNAWTRKSELQANCLAGVFLGSIEVTYPLTEGDVDAVLDDATATADREDGPEEERTHGSAENSARWTEHGLVHQSPGACNTWDVDDEALVQ